jgi:hypothetical protein
MVVEKCQRERPLLFPSSSNPSLACLKHRASNVAPLNASTIYFAVSTRIAVAASFGPTQIGNSRKLKD